MSIAFLLNASIVGAPGSFTYTRRPVCPRLPLPDQRVAGRPTTKLDPDKQMLLTTRVWFSIAALVIATLMPVNPLTVLLIFALAVDALVGMLLARDVGEARQSVMAVDADAMERRPED